MGPLLGRSGQRRGQERCEARRNPVQVGCLVLYSVEHRFGRSRAERRASGGGVSDRQRPGEYVGGWAGLSAELFRGHIADGPDRDTGASQRGPVGGLRDTEVDHLGAIVGEQDVGGFEVAMHEACSVDRHECFGEADGEALRHVGPQRPVFGDVLGEGGALYVFHDDERSARLDLDGQHACRAGALYTQERRCFTPEPCSELPVVGQVFA